MFSGTKGSGGGKSDTGWNENLFSQSSSQASLKPFLMDGGIEGGSGGGACPEPGLSGGRGGLDPPRGVSIPPLGGSGAVGDGLVTLPFLFTIDGGGGGSGPDLPGGSRTGGGGLSFAAGGRGAERGVTGEAFEDTVPRDIFRWGSRGISSFPPGPGGIGSAPGLLGGGGGGGGP